MWSAASTTPNVIHVEGSTDPLRDIGIIDIELIMADMEMVQRRLDKCAKLGQDRRQEGRPRGPGAPGPPGLAQRGQLRPRSYECSEEDAALIAESELLSLKP